VKGVPVQRSVAKKMGLRSSEANALQREVREAYDSMRSCFREMDEVLAKAVFDAGALTAVRLKLASIRLTRGPLVTRVADVLDGHVTKEEEAMLEQIRLSHLRLLQTATAHTCKWTLEAIAADWSGYRGETRKLMSEWEDKAEREQRLVHPLIQRCAGQA
jgi:hypothetical protein